MITLKEHREKFLKMICENELIDKSVEAMKELLAYYKGEIDYMPTCLLCSIGTGCDDDPCDYCPYNLDRTGCVDLAHKITGDGRVIAVRMSYRQYPGWTKKRIQDLRRWIKIYKDYKEKHRKISLH